MGNSTHMVLIYLRKVINKKIIFTMPVWTGSRLGREEGWRGRKR